MLHLLIGEQHFQLVSLLLWRNRLKQREGSGPVGDCSQAKDGDGLSETGSSHCSEPRRPALRMDSLSELPAWRSELQGVWIYFYPEKRVMVCVFP